MNMHPPPKHGVNTSISASRLIPLSSPWVVDVFALGAEDLDCALPRDVRRPHRETSLTLAKAARAAPKITVLELFEHGR